MVVRRVSRFNLVFPIGGTCEISFREALLERNPREYRGLTMNLSFFFSFLVYTFSLNAIHHINEYILNGGMVPNIEDYVKKATNLKTYHIDTAIKFYMPNN